MYCEGVSSLIEVDWTSLRARARDAAARAYAPYSRVHVGACAQLDNGRIIEGSNVENASYGLTLCAECALLGDLVRVGGGRIVAVSVVAGDGAPLTPCGRCRQLLFEHGGATVLIDAGEGHDPLALNDLLPGAFGPDDLEARANS